MELSVSFLAARPHRCFTVVTAHSNLKLRRKPLTPRRRRAIRAQASDPSLRRETDSGFALQDVPHLTNFLPDLPVSWFCYRGTFCVLLAIRVDRYVKPLGCRRRNCWLRCGRIWRKDVVLRLLQSIEREVCQLIRELAFCAAASVYVLLLFRGKNLYTILWTCIVYTVCLPCILMNNWN